MSILSRLTVTPLLYACGALLALSLGLGVALKMAHSDSRAAKADTATAVAQRDSAVTERDAWKADAVAATAANAAWEKTAQDLQAEIQRQQDEARRSEAANQQAIAAARAAYLDADRALDKFTRQFQTESRKPHCAQALSAMEAACPALRDY